MDLLLWYCVVRRVHFKKRNWTIWDISYIVVAEKEKAAVTRGAMLFCALLQAALSMTIDISSRLLIAWPR